MTRSQKSIIALLSLTACMLVLALGYYGFQYANKPLGPSLPQFAAQTMPPLWTPTLGTPRGLVTYAPTISFPSATDTPQPVCGGNGVTNILVVGADSRINNYQYGLGDAIRVVRVDFNNRKVTVLEFPRDLWVEIPYIADNINGQDHEKLNQAYLYGQPGDGFHYWDDPSAGPGLLALTLNINFGVKVDHYAAVNMQTFVKIVDSVGGIDVNIPTDKTSWDTGLPLGKHHLDGTNALKVARDRENGVFSRASNQNLVLCALRKKLTSPDVVTQIPGLIDSFKGNVFMDFTPQQLSQLACLGTKISPSSISLVSFPQEIFKESRIYDPVFKKKVFYWDVDFNVLRDYVARFQAGTWPAPLASTASIVPTSTATYSTTGFTCE